MNRVIFEENEVVAVDLQETNWAEFQFVQLTTGEICSRHKGYSRGSFWTEWVIVSHSSIEEAKNAVLSLYGAKTD